MSQQQLNQSTLTLRAITYRISSTPIKQLPHVVQRISGALWDCRELLSTTQQSAKSTGEGSTLVHRFKTSILSLLQHRTIEGRWAGVVLAKATIEAGGAEILSKSGVWVKSLIAILKKPDPPTTRTLTTIALTRIFMLTWDYPNLVREITTPNLPTFVSLCLSNAQNSKRCSSSEIESVLEAFAVLFPRHLTIFRTHEASIRSLLLRILSTSASAETPRLPYTQKHRFSASRLLVLLHHCAPKQTAAEKWRETIQTTLSAAHTTCDALFRSIVENSSSRAAGRQSDILFSSSAGQVGSESQDALGLDPWIGVFGGAARLTTFLEILERFLDTATASAVAIPIGLVVDLTIRLLGVVIPISENAPALKLNTQIPKDERDSMYAVLPEIHTAALRLVRTMTDRFGTSIVSVMQHLLERVLDVFVSEKAFVNIRTATYEVTCKIVELIGASMSKEDVGELTLIARSCCDDLLPHESVTKPANATTVNGTKSKDQNQSTDLTLPSPNANSSHPTQLLDLDRAAKALLVALISKIDVALMPRKLRVQMERTAIFSKNREALVACVLNPAKNASGTAARTSLLPLLAQLFPKSNEVEALLRPRMPVVLPQVRINEAGAETPDEEEVDAASGASNDADGYLVEDVINHDEDDLYTASPPLPPKSKAIPPDVYTGLDSSNDIDSALKRSAIESLDDVHSTKRRRATPSVEASAAEITAPSPQLRTDASKHAEVDQPQSQAEILQRTGDVTMLPADALSNPQAGSYHAESTFVDNRKDDSDGSDIEVPPLTMESDSEPEDDEED